MASNCSSSIYFEIILHAYSLIFPPAPGATLCSTEDGSKIFLFGGHDGEEYLRDVYMLDLNRTTWSSMSCQGEVPEPRQGHVAGLLGSGDHYYMMVSGGAAGSCMDVCERRFITVIT